MIKAVISSVHRGEGRAREGLGFEGREEGGQPRGTLARPQSSPGKGVPGPGRPGLYVSMVGDRVQMVRHQARESEPEP